MTDVSEVAAHEGQGRHPVEVADQSLAYRSVQIDDLTPTGAQLAAAAGFKAAQGAVVLQVLPNAELEDIRPEETVDLRHQDGRFVIVQSDRIYLLTINGVRFDWPCRVISGAVVRKLGDVAHAESVYLAQVDEPDRLVGDHDLIDLDQPGIEAFMSRKTTWKLNVHGVVIEVSTPTIVVKDALEQAGFDVTQNWQIFLKVAGQPKQAVGLTGVVDLTTLGIEKLRLSPAQVNNGEAPPAPRRDFEVLDVDQAHLKRLGLRWETIEEGGRRWLVIYNYPVPAGYTVQVTTLALEVPPTYPGAQIYGFYAYPPLALAAGRAIPSTQLRGIIHNKEFHGWSRNRGSQDWNVARDNVVTQLALVEAALAYEVGE